MRGCMIIIPRCIGGIGGLKDGNEKDLANIKADRQELFIVEAARREP